MARFGAELSQAQRSLRPEVFARLVETLGIGRAKAERLMGTARLQSGQIDEARPSAWSTVFGRLEPMPLLPGEADAIVAEAVAASEPPVYRRRRDLLSADGLVLMLIAMHSPTALSFQVRQRLSDWLCDQAPTGEALAILRGWRSNDSRHPPRSRGIGEGIPVPQEAPR